jgi:disulfide oxidoreductase YuzD
MVQTFSDNKKIYSVDMMFAYLNLFDHPIANLEVNNFLHVLEYKGWGNPSKGIFYSSMDVLNNSNNKKYSNEIKRIKEANLNYPIIIYNNNIVDGVHRLTKAYLENKKTIKAYIFKSDLMKKFLIDNNKNWLKVDNMQMYDYIKLFYKRFRD